jgi:hypothetical protein
MSTLIRFTYTSNMTLQEVPAVVEAAAAPVVAVLVMAVPAMGVAVMAVLVVVAPVVEALVVGLLPVIRAMEEPQVEREREGESHRGNRRKWMGKSELCLSLYLLEWSLSSARVRRFLPNNPVVAIR